MNYLSNTIIENAAYWQKKWQKNECKSTGNNRGDCLDEIKAIYGGEVISSPWCAEFVSVVVKTSCVKLSITNRLPYTRSTSEMLSGAKKNGLVVDKSPVIGCVFYRSREGGGHVGIVADITNTGIITIEGNTDSAKVKDAVLGRSYKFKEIESWQFIHTENMGDTSLFKYVFRDGIPIPLYIATGVGVIGAIAWYYNKKMKFVPQLAERTYGAADEPNGAETIEEVGERTPDGVS